MYCDTISIKESFYVSEESQIPGKEVGKLVQRLEAASLNSLFMTLPPILFHKPYLKREKKWKLKLGFQNTCVACSLLRRGVVYPSMA